MADHSLKKIAYKHIKDQIINCRIKGGDRIREDLLAEDLEMSRTPVREAINQLVMEGLVQSVPRKGLYCVELTSDMINDLCDIRAILETYAIRRCVERCSPTEIKDIQKLAFKFDELAKMRHSTSFTDDELHEKIMQLSGNAHIVVVYSSLANYLHILRTMTEARASKWVTHVSTSGKEHWDLIQCIIDKDEQKAVEIMNSHIEQMRAYLLDGELKAQTGT